MFSGAKKFLFYVEHVPEKYRSGQWSPVTHLIVHSYSACLLICLPLALNDISWSETQSYDGNLRTTILQLFRLFGFLFGGIVIKLAFLHLGMWPFASYTFTSWNLMTMRCALSFMGGFGHDSVFLQHLQNLADVIRFPALVGCSITVLIWWAVLVPVIDTFLRKNDQQRQNFWALNQSFLLVSVHFLNVVVAGTEFMLTARPLTHFDLWMGCLVALLYCLFYLNVLVARDLHFYIILSPQTALSALSYALILSLYYAVFLMWNGALNVTWH